MYSRLLIMAAMMALTLSCAQQPVNNTGTTAPQQSSTDPDKALNQEVAAQPPRSMHGEVAYKGFESIRESKSLTEEQKTKLMQIHSEMSKSVFQNQEQTSKLKAVLFETITTKPYNSKKVDNIKKQLTQLNHEKMQMMFTALDKFQKVVGVSSVPDHEDLFREFLVEKRFEAHQ